MANTCPQFYVKLHFIVQFKMYIKGHKLPQKILLPIKIKLVAGTPESKYLTKMRRHCMLFGQMNFS